MMGHMDHGSQKMTHFHLWTGECIRSSMFQPSDSVRHSPGSNLSIPMVALRLSSSLKLVLKHGRRYKWINLLSTFLDKTFSCPIIITVKLN